MRKSYKTNNFLNVINKYAKRQKSKIVEEIRAQEQISQKKLENEILEDSKNMIKKEIINLENELSVEISHKEQEERKKVSQKRKEIMKDMFSECHKKLCEFCNSKKYEIFFEKSCEEVSKLLKLNNNNLENNKNNIKILIKAQDIKFENIIKKYFSNISNLEIEITDNINIGGIILYNINKKIIIDDSLDSRLKEQKNWAYENFGVLLV